MARLIGAVLSLALVSAAARADEPCAAVPGSTGALVVPAHCDGKLFHFHAPGPLAIGFHVAAMAFIVTDISLSLDIKNHQNEIRSDGTRFAETESNPLLGRHPSDGRFVLYGASVIAIHTALWYIAPEEIRPVLDLVVIAVEIPYIGGNIDAGLRLRFPF